jgi:hypothetical protein
LPIAVTPPAVVNNCYLNLDDFSGTSNACSKDMFSNNNLKIEITIYVEDVANPGNKKL